MREKGPSCPIIPPGTAEDLVSHRAAIPIAEIRAAIPIAEIRAARRRLRDAAVRTPLLRLHLEADELPESLRRDPPEIHLKLENLQPIGSFKLRGAGNTAPESKPSA